MRHPVAAAFVRGGTSKGLVFHREDLPDDRADRDALFLRAMGSPDEYGRQLDGMGGGISSLSKVCVVGPPTHPDADVDYLFGQVQVDTASVDYGGNCGNMSSAIGPFAVDEGIVPVPADGQARVRIHNVNTGKLIASTFSVRNGRSVVDGDYAIKGVSGTAAPVRLDFLDPGGAVTGRLLPTGNSRDRVDVDSIGAVEVSYVDAANPCVFVPAEALSLVGTESPEEIEAAPGLLDRLETIRRAAAVAMRIAATVEEAAANRLVPFIAVVGPPATYRTLSNEHVASDDVDVIVRFISSGRPHRAVPVTGALCSSIAARLPGTVVNDAARPASSSADPIRIGTPSGVLDANAAVADTADGWRAVHASTYRTTRRLFDGYVYA
ncbi:PrpF domain-containing protein [Gordonia humi]|uniref:PrpF family protein n=1 Tax=Gordonia humi TaxID=686429 RepID=A0A840ET89_9ACTN|nr:hypothetical protein [Gordonia humi]